MPVDRSKASEALAWIESKKGGEAHVVNRADKSGQKPLSIPFLSPTLTWATKGGVRIGHFNRLYGPEGCLDADTFLQYEVRTKEGARQNNKGGTIKRLYERFNGIRGSRLGEYQRPETVDSNFFLSCMNEEGRIFQNKIIGVVHTGTKICWKIETKDGKFIEATEDHKFFTGDGYVAVQNLDEGDVVYVHNNTRANGRKPRVNRKQTTVKNHPYGQLKEVNGYKYKQLYVSRLVVEADLNDLEYEAFISKLNSGDIGDLVFLHPDQHVHHVNEDVADNDIENLTVIWAEEHNRYHALKCHNNLRFTVVESEIVSITEAGLRETYDVQMADPFNNYIANGFVVHNSGKSLSNWGLAYVAQNYPSYMTILMEREIKFWEAKKKKFKTLALAKRLKVIQERFPDGMNVMLFDTEQRAEKEFGARLGVDMREEHCAIIEQNIIEEIINEIKGSIDAYHLFLIDSVSNAQSYQEANLSPGDYERGTAAAAWKRLRQVRKRWDRMENTLIFVDQMRMQLGQRNNVRAAPSQIRFIKHNISLDVEFDRGKKLYLDKNMMLTDDKDKATDEFHAMGGEGKSVAGLEMKCQVQKNSTGKPWDNAVMRFRFDVANPATGEMVQEIGFDQAYELLKIGEYYHVLEFGGGGMVYLLDENFKRTNDKWKGEARVMQALSEDQALIDMLLNRIAIDV